MGVLRFRERKEEIIRESAEVSKIKINCSISNRLKKGEEEVDLKINKIYSMSSSESGEDSSEDSPDHHQHEDEEYPDHSCPHPKSHLVIISYDDNNNLIFPFLLSSP